MCPAPCLRILKHALGRKETKNKSGFALPVLNPQHSMPEVLPSVIHRALTHILAAPPTTTIACQACPSSYPDPTHVAKSTQTAVLRSRARWHGSYRDGLGIIWLGFFQNDSSDINVINKTWFGGGTQVNGWEVRRRCGECSLRPQALVCIVLGLELRGCRGAFYHWLPVTSRPWVVSFEVWSTLVCRFSFEVYSRILQALFSFQPSLNKNSKPHHRSQLDVTKLREKKKANVPFLVIVSSLYPSD